MVMLLNPGSGHASPLTGSVAPTHFLELDTVGLDPLRAETALNLLIERHERLRAVTLPGGGQRVLPAGELAPVRIPVTDLAGLSARQQQARLGDIRAQLLQDGVHPASWPLFRIAICRLRRRRCRVLVAASLQLADSASLWMLVRELQILHQDPTAPLPEVPRTFGEPGQAQCQEKQCQEKQCQEKQCQEKQCQEKQWPYWAARLDSLPAAPELPLAGRPGVMDPVGFWRRECRLSPVEWQWLQASCRRHGMEPAAALAHVFAETLGAWAGQPRFCLGVLRPGRLNSAFPLEVDLGGDRGFWPRGRRLRDQLHRDLGHADIGAERIMQEVAARRGWSQRGALLPYLFHSAVGVSAGPCTARPVGQIVTTALRDPQVLIHNQVQDTPDGGIQCTWDVVDDAFPADLPDAMFDAYQRLLRTTVGGRRMRSRPDPVPPGHRALVAVANGSARPARASADRLEDGFLRQAARRPDDVAVITSARTLTYRELEAESRAVATWLTRGGVGRGDVVAIVMNRGWEQVAAALGILRAGAAYCPADALLPSARISELLTRCRARAVLTQSYCGFPAGAAGAAPPVLAVDRQRPADAPIAATPGGPEDLAYVMFTSGSTGPPKGVMIEHRGVVNSVRAISQRIKLSPADRVFGISPLSFDLSVWDIFGTLAAGAALVMPDASPSLQPDPAGWADTAIAGGVTICNSAPMLAERFAERFAEVADERSGPAVAPVRAFIMGGDRIPLTLPRRLRQLWPDCRILAVGGATEAPIWSSAFEVRGVDPAWLSIPYGTPLPGQTMRVLDHHLDIRPPWAPGRIYIGGAGLARGYLGDAQRTAERFITHPVTAERLYRTGDLGRYRPDGTIELLGREDRQLRIQGLRIPPGEIEAAVRDCPGVRDCTVTMVTTGNEPAGRPCLVALVVPEPGGRPEAQAIVARLRTRFPYYLIPERIHVTERLPLTPNGKVDISRAVVQLCEPPCPGSTGSR